MDLGKANDLALELISQHGLSDWGFRFNKHRRTLGICKTREKRIELSSYYVQNNSQEHVTDTILHEIAHALVGPEHGHNEVWKAKCQDLGCQPKSCAKDAQMPPGSWQARCAGCLSVFHRHVRPKVLSGLYCRLCGPEKGGLVFRKAKLAVFTPVAPIQESYLRKPRQLTLPFSGYEP